MELPWSRKVFFFVTQLYNIKYFFTTKSLFFLPFYGLIQVDYENHPHFKGKQDKGSKRGSPVRIFTNIKPCDIKLPADEGYK